MPKTKDAFAFANFDSARILQRSFCKEFREAWQATLNMTTDDEILDYFCFSYRDSLPNYQRRLDAQYILDGLDELLRDYVTPYQKHLKQHVGRLTRYTNAVANKIAADETDDVTSLRARHKRAVKLIAQYNNSVACVDGLKKQLSEQYKTVDDEIRYQYRKTFGERLRQARLAAGLTQAQLGESLRLSQKTISGYEIGDREPSLAQMVRFAYKLNHPVGWFLNAETIFGR